VKRGREAACIYPPPPVKSKPTNVKGRIRQLESLVVDLMNQQQKQPLSTPHTSRSPAARSRSAPSEVIESVPYAEAASPGDIDAAPRSNSISLSTSGSDSGIDKPFGHMSIKRDEVSYHGASHWQTILSSIADLRHELDQDEDDTDDPATNYGAPESRTRERFNAKGSPTASHELGLLVGSPENLTKDDLIKAMPDKRTADRLLSLWFNSSDSFRPTIHAPTYQEEYKKFWDDPNRACVSWLGLTFAIMSLAESFSLRGVDPRGTEGKAVLVRVKRLHSLSASAAVLADFTTPKKYTLECLLFYMSGLRGNDGFMKVWLTIGLIVRLALRMGYHRDPKYYPRLSVFEGEMRRRVWCVVSMVDTFMSFQLGLPSMVKTIATDIEPPRNLLDRDFGPSTKVLPPSRSMDELTPASYMRFKLIISQIFSQAADLGHSTVPVAHEEVMRLDSELETAWANVPSVLDLPNVDEMAADPPEQLICRMNLKLLVLKTRIILHRNLMLVPIEQLSEAEQAQGIGTSRKICVDSALEVLKLQHTIHAESQLGGKLYTSQWYMGSISTHDFLLAAMVVCLNLSQQISEDDQLRTIGTASWCPRRQAMADTLEKSYHIFTYGSAASRFGARLGSLHTAFEGTQSSETDMASKALGVMLDRVRKHFGGRVDGNGVCGALPSPAQTSEPIGSATAPILGVGPPSIWTNNTPDHTSQRDSVLASATDGNSNFPYPAMSDMLETNQTLDSDMPSVDFSAIGDMIDGPVNWDMWDDQIMQQQVQQAGSWNDTVNYPPGPLHADIWAPPQAEGQYAQPAVPGDAYNMDSFAPGPQGANASLPYDWQDLEDVDLDIRDYGTGGFWGKSSR
jgi:hypothetical protein